MSFHLGRLVLPEPSIWSSTGATHVQVTGSYKASSLTDGLVKRDQLLSLADDLDVPVIPVTIDNEPRVNGYYRVLGVTFITDEFVRKQGNLYDYRVDLQPVWGFASPWLECILSGALLTNAVGAVAADPMYFHALPQAALEYAPPLPATATSAARTSPDGVLTFFEQTGNTGASGIARFGLPPASFYIGAATFEQGSPLLPVVGRMFAQANTTAWRLSNGLVRVTPNASVGKLDISHYNSVNSAWSAVKTYQLSFRGIVANGINSITVLRNSVEESIIRLSLAGYGVGNLVTLDLSLRRGDRLVRCYFSAAGVQAANNFKVQRDTVEAATAITFAAVTLGGIRATNVDGDGNRYVLLSYQTTPTTDLVNGAVSSAVGLTADFGIGSEVNIVAGNAPVPDRAVDVAQQYLAAQSESQRVVAR